MIQNAVIQKIFSKKQVLLRLIQPFPFAEKLMSKGCVLLLWLYFPFPLISRLNKWVNKMNQIDLCTLKGYLETNEILIENIHQQLFLTTDGK